MANQKSIKKRIGSVGNIGKITRALEMVSAAKVQKAQERAESAKPYAQLVYKLTQNLSSEIVNRSQIPLLRQPENINNILFVIVSTNRGLTGNLNANLLRSLGAAIKSEKTNKKLFITVGTKGRNFALNNGQLIADYSEEVTRDDVSALTANISKLFTSGEVDKVIFVYNNFVSALLQEPTFKQLLPIGKPEEQENTDLSGYTFEPEMEILLAQVLPFYLENQVRDILTQAEASEHSARMIAMKNASDNAESLSHNLSLYYNKIRQQGITNEINEIVTAGLALE